MIGAGPPVVEIDETAIEEDFILGAGPGGQAVNKQATAVQLRYDTGRARGLNDGMRRRLRTIAGKRMNRDGIIVITAHRFRSQGQNRHDARARLLAMLEQAATVPKPRRPTKPSKGARRRRLDAKRAHGRTKRLRRPDSGSEE